jgi:hypothetical protein
MNDKLIITQNIKLDKSKIKFDLYYPILDNKLKKYNLINIKGIEDKIYLYVITDIKKFIHIFNFNGDEIIQKYITLSTNNNIISIPDENYLYFYKVNKIIEDGELELSEINSRIFLNGIPKIQKLNSKKNIDCDDIFNPEKCYFYKNKFVIISNDTNKSGNYILINKFSTNQSKMIDYDMNMFWISENCNYILLLNNNILYTFNVECVNEIINDRQIKCDKLSKFINRTNTVISDNGDYICVYTEKKLFVLNLDNNIDEQYDINSFGKPENIIIKIYDFNSFIIGMKDFNKLNVILLWNTKLNKFKYWILFKYDKEYLSSNEYNINSTNPIDSISNVSSESIYGFTYILENNDILNIVNIEKIIIMNIIDFIIQSIYYKFEIKQKENVNLILNNNKIIIKKWMEPIFIEKYDNIILCVQVLNNENMVKFDYKLIIDFIKIMKLSNSIYVEFLFIKIIYKYLIENVTIRNKLLSNIYKLIKQMNLIRPFLIQSLFKLFNIENLF